MAIDQSDTSVLHISASSGWVSLKLHELWRARELVYFLIWRDIKVRYKQTVLGAAWAILQPFLAMLVFSLFFGHLAKIPSDNIPYPIFSYCGLVPWMFFANGLNQASNSLISNSSLITKIYFPRLAIPVAAVMSGVVDFVLAFAVLVGMMLYYKVMPTLNIVWIPALLVLALATSLAGGLWLSALHVKYHDVRYIVPFLVQFWLFATPIAYPSSLLHEPWRTLYGANPMVGVVEGFRWALLGTGRSPSSIVAISAGITLVLLIGGAFYFRRTEKAFADIV